MRSPTGPLLILLGLATTVVLALLLFQVLGLREDLDRAREEVSTLQASVEAGSDAVTLTELEERLDGLEADLRLEIAGTRQPAGGSGGSGDPGAGLTARIDEVLERITSLDDRVDEICESVPVC